MATFTKVGTLHFENGECRDISRAAWSCVLKYPNSTSTVEKDGNTYLYCIAEVSGGWWPTEHFWSVYEGRPAEGIPDYLTKQNPN